MFRFNWQYFAFTCILFITEILIAVFVNDHFVRPYVGDYLVVILVYCFLRSFIKIPFWIAAISALLFSFAVETLQYFDLVHMLGLQHSRLANIVIGNSFSWSDILAYTLGILTVLLIEYTLKRRSKAEDSEFVVRR